MSDAENSSACEKRVDETRRTVACGGLTGSSLPVLFLRGGADWTGHADVRKGSSAAQTEQQDLLDRANASGTCPRNNGGTILDGALHSSLSGKALERLLSHHNDPRCIT
jgi:hypothetical protein